MTLDCVPFDLKAVVEDVLKLIFPRARAQGLISARTRARS